MIHVLLMMIGVDVFVYSGISCNAIGMGLIDHGK